MPLIQGHNSPLMKVRNRSAVLRLLLERGPMARRDIATTLGLTPATITNVTRELIRLDLIEERNGHAHVADARKAVPLDVRGAGAAALGINLGRPGAALCVVDLRGTVLAEARLPYADHAPASVTQAVAATGQRLLAESMVDDRRLVGVSVGVAGVVAPDRDAIRAHLALGWRDVPFGALLGAALGRPVVVENNVHAMAVNERLFGVAAGAGDVVLLFVSATIGAGVLVDGALHRGHHASAGLVGHIVVEPDGPLCSCGSRGCLEAVASTEAIVEAWEPQRAGPHAPSYPRFLAATRAGDERARRLLARQAYHVGGAVAHLLHVLDPDLVVLAGPGAVDDVDLAGESWLEIVRRIARQRAPLLDVPDERIVASGFGADAAMRGAAAIALGDFLEQVPFVGQNGAGLVAPP
jgi:predicted NBD/HSP70 family sugar kinase